MPVARSRRDPAPYSHSAVQVGIEPRHDAYEGQAEGDVSEVGDDVVECAELNPGSSGGTESESHAKHVQSRTRVLRAVYDDVFSARGGR